MGDAKGNPDLRDEIGQRLQAHEYAVNTETCPDKRNALWASPLNRGKMRKRLIRAAKSNKVPAGLNLRMFGDDKAKNCAQPNQWPAVLV